ncbi:MAG: OPT/YSL family transporter [Phycisphaerae bacterium]|nr:MAG: OPT family oligopeptide transporter [Planctomycetota bacterium]MBE7458058.1 OPT/YSL family transporter [Planctomycetia bacterium]MCK6464478.1 OPT/YSL family transporter [Phycisphaerae bacterium]MCL4717972.1 OPT/YSL family transporter [Phycisphaerae bacterium]MCQ3922217.1 hypothetical protein [Planctomycetota bacterium]
MTETCTQPDPPAERSVAEADAAWSAEVRSNDRTPQLTVRAVLTGGLLGMLLSISNLYTVLQLGWAFGVAITACVLSYLMWNAARAASFGRIAPMTLLESNVMQSTASAAGYSTGSTIGTAFGALLLSTGRHVPWLALASFTLCTALLGVLLAVPLKRQMINIEQLRFPSGTAAAQTLRSLYSRGGDALRQAYALIACLALGGAIGLLRNYGLLVDRLQRLSRCPAWLSDLHARVFLPHQIEFPTQALTGVRGGKLWNFGFDPGVLMIGAGMLIGPRAGLSMLAGATALYFGVGPYLVSLDQANPASGWTTVAEGESAPVYDAVRASPGAAHVPVTAGGVIQVVRWGLWGGSSLLVFASLASLALQWRVVGRSFMKLGGGADGVDVEVPLRWFMLGVVPVAAGLVAVQVLAFGISAALGVVAVGMSFVVSLVCCRVTGETDTTPIGPMGKMTQLVYAVLPGSAGDAAINLTAAGATTSAGSSAADLLNDLKAGYLLGANPRKQFAAQLAGVFFGTAAVVPAWYLMVPDAAALGGFNAPSAQMWKAVADALTQGLQSLPISARWAIVIGGLTGVAIPAIGALSPRAARYLPSPMGLGFSWVFGFNSSLALAVGSVIAWTWGRAARRSAEAYAVPAASGFIAGESLVSALLAIAASAAGLAWAGGAGD